MRQNGTQRQYRSGSGRVSFLIERKGWLTLALLFLMLLVCMVVSAGIGTLRIAPLDALLATFGYGEPVHVMTVQKLRMPRIVTGAFVGASLAASGAIMQGLIRNPLASPDIIGITGGASVAATALLTLAPSASIAWLPPTAFAGAALMTFIVYGLAWKQGVKPTTLVLIGVGVGAAAQAVNTMLVVMSPMYVTAKAYNWLLGSVYGVGWPQAKQILIWFAVTGLIAFILSRRINLLQLGDDVAQAAGSSVQRDRFLLLGTAAVLAGAGVAIGGPIGFIALMAPHIARRFAGVTYGLLIPTSALVGAILIVIADTAARTVMSPLDIPVGVFTAAIGAPFFIILLLRRKRSGD